jgi:exonuclease VII large subunit
MQRISFEEEKVQTQQSKERKDRLDQAVSESQKKLKEAIPQWNDDLYQSLLKRSYDTYGFKPDEMSAVWDHRIMRVLHDAHQWRATQEGKPLAEKKVVNVPQVLRPGNAKPKVDPKTQELQKARQQLSANGNDMDAAASLMSQFIGKR